MRPIDHRANRDTRIVPVGNELQSGHPDEAGRPRNPYSAACRLSSSSRVGVIDVAVIANALADRPCLRLAARKFDEPEAFPISGHPIDRQHSRARLVAHALKSRGSSDHDVALDQLRSRRSPCCRSASRDATPGRGQMPASVSRRSRSTMSMLHLSLSSIRIEHVGHTAAHAGEKLRPVPPRDDSTTGAIYRSRDRRRLRPLCAPMLRTANRSATPPKKCLAARRPIESDVADDHVVFCRIRRGARRRTIKRPPESPFRRSRWLRLRARA